MPHFSRFFEKRAATPPTPRAFLFIATEPRKCQPNPQPNITILFSRAASRSVADDDELIPTVHLLEL